MWGKILYMKKIISLLILSICIFTQSTVLAAVNPVVEATNAELDSQSTFQGRAEITDRLDKENKKLFTGEIDQLETKDVIKMTVSQVLSSGYTEEGDEFFAEISSDVERS